MRRLWRALTSAGALAPEQASLLPGGPGAGAPAAIVSKGPLVVAAVGSGGKSSLLRTVAQGWLRLDTVLMKGSRLLFAPTTRIRPDKDLEGLAYERLLLEDPPGGTEALRHPADAAAALAESTRSLWQTCRTVLIGERPEPEGKIAGCSPHLVTETARLCEPDVVLCEADGSRGMPLKLPADDEPLLPEADVVFWVAGLDVAGLEAAACVHRWESRTRLGHPLLPQGTKLTEAVIERILVDGGYVEKLPRESACIVLFTGVKEYNEPSACRFADAIQRKRRALTADEGGRGFHVFACGRPEERWRLLAAP